MSARCRRAPRCVHPSLPAAHLPCAAQLFGLVNTLLSTDRATARRDLAIQRYSIVPLSPNSGLISWVPRCDTLHALVKEYREQRRTLLNIEHRLILQMAPTYDLLPVLHKLEVFEYALENTGGQDLAKAQADPRPDLPRSALRSRPTSRDLAPEPRARAYARRCSGCARATPSTGCSGAPTTRARSRSCRWSATSSGWATAISRT